MINVCEKHNLQRILTEVERGKTLYICSECEKEQQDRINQIAWAMPVVSFCSRRLEFRSHDRHVWMRRRWQPALGNRSKD